MGTVDASAIIEACVAAGIPGSQWKQSRWIDAVTKVPLLDKFRPSKGHILNILEALAQLSEQHNEDSEMSTVDKFVTFVFKLFAPVSCLSGCWNFNTLQAAATR
eukprot:GHVT01000667.1.p2 GENE.GHVT01000667.1~~GHVT01000667.1.p2  ORF type:complete len:104 (-),score=8.69 GHVT01000667.1:1155-1466(-)